MPTYQYRCTECGHDLEAVQKFTDDPLTECPECDGSLRKVFTPVGVVFKGSGFYATDNRSKGKANAASPGETQTKGTTEAPSSEKASTKKSSSSGKSSTGDTTAA